MRQHLLVTAVIACVVLAGLAVAGLRPKPVATPPAPPPAALPALRAQIGSADRIEFSRGSKLLWLERRGQMWGLSQAGGYPVQPAQAAALLDGLQSLRLDQPVTGDSAALGVADPGAQPGGGTLVRVLAISGTVLAALIVSTDRDPAYFRQPGLPQIWRASQAIPASLDPADWTDRHLPLPHLVGSGAAAMQQALAALAVTQIRAAPQIRLDHPQTAVLSLEDGTAVLTLGQVDGQDWLRISGSSAWARSVSPYAFAISGDIIPDLTP